MAGIVGAARDGNGVHGVAYDAELVSLKVLIDDWYDSGVTTETGDSDIALALLSAAGIADTVNVYDSSGFVTGIAATLPEARVDVVNMSFAGHGSSAQVRDAMARAADAGTIMVVALGNFGVAGATGSPASYVDWAGGMALAVAALDGTGTALSSEAGSSSCGAVYHCLAAPGEDIYSTLPTYANSEGATYYGTLSGTSMAAPYVTGAAAAALAAFPGVAPADVVTRILATTDDLGDPGFDSVFGHGSLNLAALLSPVGALSVPAGTSTTGTTVAASSFSALSGPGGGGTAVAVAAADVMALDAMGFPFALDLSTTGLQPRRDTGAALDGFIGIGERATRQAVVPDGSLRITFSKDPEPQGRAADLTRETGTRVDMSMALSPVLRLGITSDAPMGSELSGMHRAMLAEGPLGAEFSDADLIPFGGDGDGLRLARRLSDRTWLELGWHEGASWTGDEIAEDVEVEALTVTARHTRDRWEASLRAAAIAETGAVLGTVYEGFASNVASDTMALGLDMAWHPSQRFALSAGYALAETRVTANGLTRFDRQLSDSASLAASVTGLFAKGDRLTLSASLPFATRVAGATLSLPVARTETGAVITQAVDVDLAPDAREQLLQAVWSLPFGHAARFDLAGYHRANADHIAGSEDWGAALRVSVQF